MSPGGVGGNTMEVFTSHAEKGIGEKVRLAGTIADKGK